MVSLAIGLVLTAVLLQVLSMILPGLEFESLGATFAAALVMCVVGWGVGMAFLMAHLEGSYWVRVLVEIAVNMLGLSFASAIVSGMRLSGFGAALLAGLLLTILNHAIPVVMSFAVRGR